MIRLYQLQEILVLVTVYLQKAGILRQTGSLTLVPVFSLIKKMVTVVSIIYPVVRALATVTFS